MPGIRACFRLTAALLLAVGAVALVRAQDAPRVPDAGAGSPPADTWIRDDFESPRVIWDQEQTDATVNLLEHDRSNRAAHEGRTSEHLHFTARFGSGFYFRYALPKIPITDALEASLFVRSNRAGVRLFARVILPADVDPETKQPTFLLVPGTIYDSVDRWQRLDLIDLRRATERQARVLRVATRRPVSLDGAYLEQLVVNVFTGTGESEVFLDELRVGPVPPETALAFAGRASDADAETPKPEAGSPRGTDGESKAGGSHKYARVRMDRSRLKRQGDDGLYHDWFCTGIDAPGADVTSLRNAGFDVLVDDIDADPKRFADAVAKGFLLIPRLGRDGHLVEPDQVVADALAFPRRESVLAWDVGDHLGRNPDAAERRAERSRIKAAVTRMRSMPAGVSPLLTGTVDDDLPQFARPPQNLEMLGIDPSAWGSNQSLLETLTYLRQRRDLTVTSNVGAFFWARIPATPPRSIVQGIWGRDVPPSWGQPVIQPEQIRLYAYAALSVGYRGLVYHGDAELTGNSGRMNLIEMSFLNAEVDLCESILARGEDPIASYNAFPPDPSMLPPAGARPNTRVKSQVELAPLPGLYTAAIGANHRKGVLLLVSDFGGASQFQPGQLAHNDVHLTVVAPEGAEPFEISLGGVRHLEGRRYVGGVRIVIPEFDTTTLILMTTDLSMKDRLEAVVNSIRPRAAQMAIEQARLKLAWVSEINGRLAAEGHYLLEEKELKKRATNGGSPPTDQADLLAKAASLVKSAEEHLEREDYEQAWFEARRASRPLRILMSGLWTNALRAMNRANALEEDLKNEELRMVGRAKLVGPELLLPGVASVPLAAFNTLPQHYRWVDWMKTAHFGKNLVPSGSFDHPEEMKEAGWSSDAYQYEGLKSTVTTKVNSKDGARRIVKMTVDYKDALPPFLDFPAAAIRSPAVPMKAGEFYRISVYVQRPVASGPGKGGIVVRDSIGGEALQFSSTAPLPKLQKVVLYRRAPADGALTVTLGLAGYGDAYFDDFAIERVEAPPSGTDPGSVAELPRPRRPPVAPSTATREESRPRPTR